MTDDHTKGSDNGDSKDVSRRSFLKNTGIAAGGVIGGAVLGGVVGNSFRSDEKTGEVPKVDYSEARQFFKREEDFEVLSMITERIFPEEETGPGAIELGVPYYIDRQLAGV